MEINLTRSRKIKTIINIDKKRMQWGDRPRKEEGLNLLYTNTYILEHTNT